jgi:hypothetical protein
VGVTAPADISALTVNDPTAVTVPSAVVFAAMVYGPAETDGTVTVHVNPPVLDTVTVP